MVIDCMAFVQEMEKPLTRKNMFRPCKTLLWQGGTDNTDYEEIHIVFDLYDLASSLK